MDAEKPYIPIDCNLYDYLEIACLLAYEVELALSDGSSLRGVAMTTRTSANAEFLVLKVSGNDLSVRLDLLVTLQVLSKPRQFDSVLFRT